ncbi:MAG: T9SS type A sorting domain-containing protein [Salinivirgaceae bacterium]|nr:T9SS type A sorting domain-containing protein [Salinivirgaceae bacterium]
MKNFVFQSSIHLILSLCILFPAEVTKAQNFWEYSQQKSKNALNDTNCPVYNAYDPKITIEWQYALGEQGYDNSAYDIEFTPDSNLVYLYYSAFFQTYYLVCIEQNSNELWRTSIMANDTLSYGRKINWVDNYLYVSGSWDIGNTRFFGVTKLDKNGNQLWFKQLFSNSTTQKRIREYNPYLINVEDNFFLGSIVDKNELFVTKMDSSCNVIWKKTLTELGSNEYIRIFNVAFNLESYYVFASTLDTCYYWNIDLNGDVIKKGEIAEWHFATTWKNNKFYFTGSDYPDQWVRRYSNNLELEMEYRKLNSIEQYKIYDASDLRILKDKSILVFYDFLYDETGLGDMHTNFQVLHISEMGDCLSTLNLYSPNSQYSKKMLITNDESCIVFGYGYNYNYGKDMVAIGKIKRWDPVSISNTKVDSDEIMIFPNPVKNELNVSFSTLFTGEFKLMSINGFLIKQKTIYHLSYFNEDISNIRPGIYITEFISNKKTTRLKIIKL